MNGTLSFFKTMCNVICYGFSQKMGNTSTINDRASIDPTCRYVFFDSSSILYAGTRDFKSPVNKELFLEILPTVNSLSGPPANKKSSHMHHEGNVL